MVKQVPSAELLVLTNISISSSPVIDMGFFFQFSQSQSQNDWVDVAHGILFAHGKQFLATTTPGQME